MSDDEVGTPIGHAPQVLTAEEAVALIPDDAALTVEGSGGGLLEPDALLRALGARFDATSRPRGLTLVHCTGIGDRKGGGLDLIARDGLLKRVIGGNWGMAPDMCALALGDKIEAYNFPQGVMSQMYREIAAGRPGLITHVGLETFCDPRLEGGRLNEVTREDLVEVIELSGQEWLFYHKFPMDVAFIRGTTADTRGNISMEHEGVRLEALAIAQAAKNNGGIVIAQVKYMAKAGSLDPRSVVVPGVLVDVLVLHENQRQTVETEYQPAFSGGLKIPIEDLPTLGPGPRQIIARRATLEIHDGSMINLGVGMPDGVASVVAEEGLLDGVTMSIEQGLVGGVPARGVIFGVSYNPAAIIDQPSQFDFYDGGGLDAAFLGFAQVDAQGNVNVSKFGDVLIGTGGFVNISQNAKKVIFCGSFTSGGLEISVDDGRIEVLQEGRHRKFMSEVEQITFNGHRAQRSGQQVMYITERAVFGLSSDGLALLEVAPGIDVEKDILQHLPFTLTVDAPREMGLELFKEEPMGLTLKQREPAPSFKVIATGPRQ